MTSRRRAQVDQSGNAKRLAVFGAGLALSVLSVWSALGLWQRLPRQQVAALRGDEINRALRRASTSAPARVREAWLLSEVSEQFTAALRDDAALQRLSAEVGSYAAGQRHTELGRLQQAAVHMLELERAGTPMQQWWPALEPYLRGLRGAGFAHFEGERVAAWTGAFRSLGVDAGTASRNAQLYAGHHHGPFLQFFVARARRVAEAEKRNGNASAAQTCRAVVESLLRQWVLEPGPPGLRLLAADLLAGMLEAEAAAPAVPQAGELARDLRAWRTAYRENASKRPADFLGLTSEPSLCPGAHRRLFVCLALTTWVCAAAAVVGVLALLSSWAWLSRRGSAARPLVKWSAVLVVTVVVTGVGLLWLLLEPDMFREDFRRDWPLGSLSEWWRHPFVSAALAVFLVVIAGLLPRRGAAVRPAALQHLGATASAVWLMLAAVALICTLVGRVAHGGYERATQAAAVDPFGAIAGAEADRFLDRLRDWEPDAD